MPPDVVTIVVSTGIGVSVVAGVLSGVCYILAHGFTRKRSRSPVLQWHCVVCGRYLRSRSVDNIKAVICIECEERVCKFRCSKPYYLRRGWICYSCLKEPSLIQGIFSAIRLQYNRLKELSLKNTRNSLAIDDMKKNIEEIRKPDKFDHIRDFIEKLVSTILGENVDDASVFRIYNDKRYDTLFEKYHEDLRNAITDLSSALHISMNNAPLAEQSPSIAHTTLKQIIENLVRETVNLPTFSKAIEYENSTPGQEQTYEELLATAILNKAVSKCQRNQPSTSPTDIINRSSASSRDKENNKEYFFGEETLDSKWNAADFETTSNSSLNEFFHSDSSSTSGSIKYVDHVSLTIRQRIEEVPPEEIDDDVKENVHYLRDKTSLLDDNDTNWYLQRPRIHGSRSPIPVPMLVPNPTTAAKVLIGDKEVDDTSDLSDAVSEYDDVDSVGNIQNYLVETKMIIGGHNPIPSITVSDGETSVDSGVKEDKDDSSDKIVQSFGFSPRTDKSVDDENISLVSFNSNCENNLEYSEKYASLPRTILKSPSPAHRYGRDYYTKQASLPSGRKRADEGEFWPSQEDTNVFKATPGQVENYVSEGEFWPSQEETDVFKATPAQVDEDYVVETNKNTILETTKETDDGVKFLEKADYSDFDLMSFEDKTDDEIVYNEENVYVSVNTQGLLCEPEDNEKYSPEIEEVEETKLIPLDPDVDQTTTAIYEVTEYTPKVENLMDTFQTTTNKEEIIVEVQATPTVVPRTFINKEKPASTVQKKENISPIYSEKTNDVGQSPENVERPPIFVSHKRSDNTWIKKIYSDPRVLSFALTNRDQIPVKIDDNFKKSEKPKPAPRQEVILSEPPLRKTATISRDYDSDDTNNHLERSISQNDDNTFSLEFSDNDSLQHQPSLKKEKEEMKDLDELKEKRIVAGRLGEFSKSFPNLSKIHSPSENYTITEQKFDDEFEKSSSTEIIHLSNENNNSVAPTNTSTQPEVETEFEDKSKKASSTEVFASVKDLRKLFESNSATYQKDKPVHSLTARSISKQIKEKLKDFDSSDK